MNGTDKIKVNRLYRVGLLLLICLLLVVSLLLLHSKGIFSNRLSNLTVDVAILLMIMPNIIEGDVRRVTSKKVWVSLVILYICIFIDSMVLFVSVKTGRNTLNSVFCVLEVVSMCLATFAGYWGIRLPKTEAKDNTKEIIDVNENKGNNSTIQ